MVNGWHLMIAPLALSAIAGPNGEADAATNCGGDETVASGLNSTPITTLIWPPSVAPGGTFQHSPRRFLNASTSLCDNCEAVASALPSDGAVLSVSAADACRVGSRLSSSAAILFGSNCGCLACACCAAFALALSSAFFFASSFFKVSAIGSIFGGSFFSSLVSLGAGGCCSAGGGGSALVASSTFFSVTLARDSSTVFFVSIFSASAAGGLSLAPSFTPLVISENCLSEMMSTGSASLGLASSGLAANDSSP